MTDLIDTTEMYLKAILELEEDGIRDRSPSRGLGDVYKRQPFGLARLMVNQS